MKKTKLDLLFDSICYLNDGAKGDFSFRNAKDEEVRVKPRQVQAFVGEKIHEFLVSAHSVVETKKGTVAVQAFGGSTDIEKIDTSVWNAFQEEDNYDMFWQEAFRTVPLRKGQLEWTIGTVTAGVVLKILEEGAKVDYANVSGTNIKGEVDLYGSGLVITWKTLEGRDLAGFFNALLEFRNKRMSEYATQHYALLAAAAVNTPIAYQLTTDDTQLDRDIATLTEGYNTIGEACKDFGFGDTANATMILYVSPRLKQRINQALRVTSSDMARAGGKGQIVDSNIEVRYTYNSAITSNTGLLVLPKNKIQNAIYMDEKTFEREDPDNLNWLKSSFTAFGAIVGEDAQTAQLSFSD